MRLRDLRKVIAENIKQLSFSAATHSNGNTLITNYHGIINSVNGLEDLMFLRDEITKLKSHCDIILYSRTPQVIVDNSVFTVLDQQIISIKMKANAVISAIDQALPEQNEFSISVKLPSLKNLSELVDIAHILDVALSGAIIREDLNGRVELQNLDTGTNWIEIIVGTKAAFSFVGKMIRASLDITKKMQEYELAKQTLRFVTIHTDAMQAVEEGLASSIKTLCQYHTDKLIQENGLITSDGDYPNRLNASIEMLVGLLSKGAEIYQPSLGEASKNGDFPSTADYKLIDSTIKQLTDTSETESEVDSEQDSESD